jgi:hypothetical protein
MKANCDTPQKQGRPAARASHSCETLFHLIPYVPKSKPIDFIGGTIGEEAHATLAISLEHAESRLDYNRQIGALVQEEIDRDYIISQALTFGLIEASGHNKVSLSVSVGP